jgi:methionine synthase II (cobalamin-independent)
LALAKAEPRDSKRYEERLADAVSEVVDRQLGHGIDVVDDGEFGKPDFVGYINERLAGFTPRRVRRAWICDARCKAFSRVL